VNEFIKISTYPVDPVFVSKASGLFAHRQDFSPSGFLVHGRSTSANRNDSRVCVVDPLAASICSA
jgi:hypothetical protein